MLYSPQPYLTRPGGSAWVAKGLVGALVLIVVAGCASDQAPVVDRLSGARVKGDADSVSVLGGRLDSLPLAVLHCSRYGRSAQFDHADGDRSVYACRVKPQ